MKSKLSWWEYEHLIKDVAYTIVGGGIVGISTAIELKLVRPESKILVLDKRNSPIAASTKNAGFACFGSISEIDEDIKNYGKEVGQKLIEMRWKGLGILKSRVSHRAMNYEAKPGAEVFESGEDFEYYKNRITEINELVEPIVGKTSCFQANRGAFGDQIINGLEGSLNPQGMMSELEKEARRLGVLFINGIEIFSINREQNSLKSSLGKLSFKKLIICTNGFTGEFLTDFDVSPARNQVFITNRIPGFKLDYCFHMHKGYVYFKEYQNRLLIGGGRHLDFNGETTSDFGNTDLIISYLKDIVDKIILPGKQYFIDHKWSGIMGVGSNKMPIVRAITDDIYIAVRMGGMGVAIGSFIGKVISAQILSIDNSAYRLYVN